MYIPLTFEGALQKCLFASSSTQGTFISGGIQYGYHTFTGSGAFEVYNGSLQAQVIVVGGGGGGGSSARASGGGGGGQVLYYPTQQLYTGTYTISVGEGGIGATQVVPGTSGGTSTITGNNLSISAVGGQPGSGQNGGTSGNGFSGGNGCSIGSGPGGIGGGGGGSTAAAANTNCGTGTKANGGAGFLFSSANVNWPFGCGGGGGSSVTEYRGESCLGGDGFGNPGTPGGPNSGNGGGGSWRSAGYAPGGNGGSGVVIIQYPINDYCKNFFNQTGSCDCREITFDITDPLNYYPQYTGSYVYTPCGTNTFVSGALKPYYPKTVCAASGSWFWVRGNSGYGNSTNTVNSSYPECFSASYGVETCVTQSFPPTCTSSIITFLAGSGSTGPQTLYYVPKNATNTIYDTLQNNYVTYKCTSSGSLFSGSLATYPAGISGIGSAIFTSSVTCNNVTFISNAAFSTRYYKYQTCGGALVTGTFFGTGNSLTACVDTRFFYGFYNGPTSGTSVTVGGNCLSGSIDTGSCGCP